MHNLNSSFKAMSVSGTDSPDWESEVYKCACAELKKISDAWGGTTLMRLAGEQWLPRFEAEFPDDYSKRLRRSVFYNAFRYSVEGLVGLVFDKPPILGKDIPPSLTTEPDVRLLGGKTRPLSFVDDVDGCGTKLAVFAKERFTEAVRDGLSAIYIDYPPKQLRPGATRADELGRRPYWIPVLRSQILSSRVVHESGRMRLMQVVIKEVKMEPAGIFGEQEITQYRVLRPGSWEVWRKPNDGDDWIVESGTTSLSEIPLAVVYGCRKGILVAEPPLEDLLDLNILHWQINSDYDHIIHVACTPLLFAKKRAQSDSPVKAAPNRIIDSNDPDGDLKYVEISGTGIAPTRQRSKDLEQQMGILALSSLAAPNKSYMTATEVLLDYAHESSKLATMAQSLQDCLENALFFTAAFMGERHGGTVNLGTDLRLLNIDPNMIAQIQLAVEKNRLPVQVLWHLLRQAGRLPDEFTDDELERRLEEQKAESEETPDMSVDVPPADHGDVQPTNMMNSGQSDDMNAPDDMGESND